MGSGSFEVHPEEEWARPAATVPASACSGPVVHAELRNRSMRSASDGLEGLSNEGSERV